MAFNVRASDTHLLRVQTIVVTVTKPKTHHFTYDTTARTYAALHTTNQLKK
jgi:hypothetical protein